MVKNKLQLIAEYTKKGKILDIGFSQQPNIYLKETDGLDLFIPKDIPNNYDKIIKCNLNIENINLPSNKYDNVILGDVIEHVENPTHMLKECNRLLKKNGRLIITTPNANDWWSIIYNSFLLNILEDHDKGEHLSNWTFTDMRRLLNKNGFKLVKLYGHRMRTPFRKPYDKLFSVKYLPFLSWQVFYIAEKINKPNELVTIKIKNKKIKLKNDRRR